MSHRILLLDDDQALVERLGCNLRGAGYDVLAAPSAEAGQAMLAAKRFDLLILDWTLPGMSGLELCTRLRRGQRNAELAVLILTARSEETDRVQGLAAGADDYVVKPFSMPELLMRVRVLLRRAGSLSESHRLQTGDLTLDSAAHKVTRGPRVVRLGPTEYRLLEVMMTNAGRVLSRHQLIDQVWGSAAEIDERTIDVHVGRLRKSLIRGKQPDPIRTVRGAGYVLEGT